MRRLAAFAVLPLLLAACQQEAKAPEVVETVAPSPDATLDLQATGIVVPAQGRAEQLDVPFGSTRAAAEASIASVAGTQKGRSENAECDAGPSQTTEYDGLALSFQEEKLVGWTARAPYVPELSRAEMLADAGVELVNGSTLGEEFTIGEASLPLISGLFAGAEDAAKVETLWAGTTCIFR